MKRIYPEMFRTVLIQEVKRRLLDESIPRLRKCLGLMSEAEIWEAPNEQTPSTGNLVLHLCGNTRQWILSGLGNQPDRRNRSAEFSEKGPIPTSRLLDMLEQLEKELNETLDEISEEQILATLQIQGFEETGLSVLVHVVEHFSYHVGQITSWLKARKNIDLGYYQHLDLDVHNAP
jgi:uncharacterized damage-inducible protein DinB